jgi:ELWxxDGT repeat protein
MKPSLIRLLLACFLTAFLVAPLLSQDSIIAVKQFSNQQYVTPGPLVSIGKTLFFFADDGVNGSQLWKSDGTSNGTAITRVVPNGSSGFLFPNVGVLGDRLLFSASGATPYGVELWKSDGTKDGTVFLKFFYYGRFSVSNSIEFAPIAGGALFNGKDSVTGQELWKTDGTPEGTVLVKDIQPGSESSGPMELTAIDSIVYFSAWSTLYGVELWRSNGTAAGTFMVKDIAPGSTSSYPSYLTAVGKTLFFVASDNIHGRELWKSDGTPEGTVMVKDVIPGSAGGLGFTIYIGRKPLVAMNGVLYFPASDGVHGYELWRSDGTESGTYLAKDINPGGGNSQDPTFNDWLVPSYGIVSNTLFFAANDGTHGTELWKTDGTAAGTLLVKDIYPGARPNPPGSIGNYPYRLTAVNGELYFVGNDSIHGPNLWKSNGTVEGTFQIPNPNPAWPYFFPSELKDFNGVLFLTAGSTLYRLASTTSEVPEFDGTLPSRCGLSQNYPNPFNPATTIKYELPRTSQVNLTVYDILGREVSVLVNERRDTGVHEVKFDGSALASGVYFYRIQAGTFVATKKLLLMK